MSDGSSGYSATAVSLGYLGGIVYLVSAGVVAIAGTIAVLSGLMPHLPVAGLVAALLIVGVLSIVFSYLLRHEPNLGLFWGAILVVIALASLGLEFGGFVLGFLLTFVAGILAIVAKLGPLLADRPH